jgi:DNA-directed RNA polymerase subunit K/omega
MPRDTLGGMADSNLHDPSAPAAPTELAPEITSRFLFVDVAAMRANQLRRGARVRLQPAEGRHMPHRLERAAMDEVKHRLVQYSVPDTPGLIK